MAVVIDLAGETLEGRGHLHGTCRKLPFTSMRQRPKNIKKERKQDTFRYQKRDEQLEFINECMRAQDTEASKMTLCKIRPQTHQLSADTARALCNGICVNVKEN